MTIDDEMELVAIEEEIKLLKSAVANLRAERDEAYAAVGRVMDLVRDAWIQWSLPVVPGIGRTSGGVATLQAIEEALRQAGLIDARGRIVSRADRSVVRGRKRRGEAKI